MKKHIVILDPFPRKLKLIFSKTKFKTLKTSYKLIYAPNKGKKKFYNKNIHKATFIIGQPDLPQALLIKAKKLKAVINVLNLVFEKINLSFLGKGSRITICFFI